MIIYQKKGQYQRYIGWYGMCDENGTPADVSTSSTAGDIDAPCQTFNLHTGRYETSLDNPIGEMPQWQFENEDDGGFREHILRVQNVSAEAIRLVYFNMENWISLYNDFVGSLGAAGARELVDEIAVYEGLSTGVVHDFLRMYCGKAYSILVKPADETGYSNGDVVRTFNMPEFYYRTVSGTGTTYRLTSACCY